MDPRVRSIRPGSRSLAGFVMACGLVSALSASGRAAAPTATIEVFGDTPERVIHPEIIGINLHPQMGAYIADPKVVQAVRRIGIRSIRFPCGCEADRYNFKAPDDEKRILVDEFLAFCEAVGAEPYFTLNLQGGTENREGPPPAEAPLEEKIKYRHTAPNPCGYKNYYFGTLAEAVELVQKYTIDRVLAGERPLICYEMGNENWGQAKSDWPPELYAATIAEYARTLRQLVADAREKNASLADLRLHITAVGYPTMGNNMDPTQATDRDINLRWTQALNALHESGLIDTVQEHFYPYSVDGLDLLIWSHHNLANIFYTRRGVPNPALGGYRDEALAYGMPIEITEWNLKCWGERRKMVAAKNLDFEEGVAGWEQQVDRRSGSVRAVSGAGRHGKGVRMVAARENESPILLTQSFDWKNKKAKRVFASAWVRTDQPDRLTMRLLPVKADGTLGEPTDDFSQRRPWRGGHWIRMGVGCTVPEGTSRLAVIFALAGPKAKVDVDAVEIFYWENERGLAPAAVNTASQQLLLVDAIRVMLAHGIRRAHLHHLFGGSACAILLREGKAKDNYRVFEFFADHLGETTVKTVVQCDAFTYDSRADKWATDFNAIAPDVADVPVVSALGMRDERYVYVLAINRTTDQPVQARIQLRNVRSGKQASVRALVCQDFDLPGVRLVERKLTGVDASFTYRLGPHTAYLFKLALAGKGS